MYGVAKEILREKMREEARLRF